MKRIRLFLSLCICLCVSDCLFAISVRLVPENSKIGSLLYARAGYNGASTNAFGPDNAYIMGIGDTYNGGLNYDLGVIKFALPLKIARSYVIDSAKIRGYCYANVSPIYLKIQRYVNDNTGNLGAADHPASAALEDVSIVSVESGYFSFDVTSGVGADVAAGKSSSSYLISAVLDQQGTPLDNASDNLFAWIAVGWSDDSQPHIDINYTATPATEVSVLVQEGKMGSLLYARAGYNGVQTTPFYSWYSINIGDVYFGGLNYDLGVIKFEIPAGISVSDTINSAYIKGYCQPGSNPAPGYLKIQRYVNDNATVLGESDHPDNSTLADVGIAAIPATGGEYFSLDITGGLAADIAAGKTYSSYLLTAVKDAQGTPLDNAVDTYNTLIATGWGDASYPHLEISYATPPANCAEVLSGGFGLVRDFSGNCVVDLADLEVIADDWLACTTPNRDGCSEGDDRIPTGTIARGTAIVDGSIDEWNGAEWIPISYNIYGNPSDVTDAKMALRWSESTDKVYAAVVVTDTTRFFSDEFYDWDAADCVEVFSQGSNLGGAYEFTKSDKAQQYFCGYADFGGQWASWYGGYPIAADANFTSAVIYNGNVITYEFGVQMFDNYAGRTGSGTTQVTQLEVGKRVRFDVVVDTRWGYNNNDFGVLASSTKTNRAGDADSMAEYLLVETLPCGGWGYLEGDIDHNCRVNLRDMAVLAQQWLLCNIPGQANCIETW